MRRFEAQILRQAGHTWSEIAALTGTPERSARRIALEAPMELVEGGDSGTSSRPGGPRVSGGFRKPVIDWLDKDEGLPTQGDRKVAISGQYL